jgi:hypothetical protein
MKKLRFVTLLLPIALVGLFVLYKDMFYIALAIASLLFSVLIIIPNLFSKKIVLKHYKPKESFIAKKEELLKGVTSGIEKRLKKRFYLPIIGALFLFFVVSFSYIAIYKLNIIPNAHNLILEYYQSQFLFLKPFLLYLIAGVVVGSYILSVFLSKYKGTHKKISFSLRHFPLYFGFVSLTLVTGFIFSFITTYLFGIGEINYIAARTNMSPPSAGVVVGKDAINKKLQDSSGKLSIIGSDNNLKSIILSQLIVRSDNQSSYYVQRIIKNIPQNLSLQINIPKQSLVMVGNTLIISEINKDDLQAVSTTIAKMFVKHYFKSRYLKDGQPNITLMGRQDYLAFREKQIDDQVSKLDDVLQKIKDYINALYGSISTDKQKIASNQNGLSSSIAQRDSAYDYCINAGYYFYGYFYHTFSQSYCDSSRASWDNIIAGFQKNISDWQAQLSYDQKELSDSQALNDYVKNIRDIVDSQRDATPQELGVFDPQDTIKVVLDSTSPKAVDNYLETLAHEYLHYTSYISDKKELDHFFEEGLTEYYARKTIKDNLGVDVNLGYPLISKLIEQMMTKIPENELQDIYFTKDQNRLIGLLDDAYGKKFYEDTQLYFMAISYAPADKALKMANNIMYRIGGKELNEQDIYSSSLSN